jgi:hypothetical protein
VVLVCFSPCPPSFLRFRPSAAICYLSYAIDPFYFACALLNPAFLRLVSCFPHPYIFLVSSFLFSFSVRICSGVTAHARKRARASFFHSIFPGAPPPSIRISSLLFGRGLPGHLLLVVATYHVARAVCTYSARPLCPPFPRLSVSVLSPLLTSTPSPSYLYSSHRFPCPCGSDTACLHTVHIVTYTASLCRIGLCCLNDDHAGVVCIQFCVLFSII